MSAAKNGKDKDKDKDKSTGIPAIARKKSTASKKTSKICASWPATKRPTPSSNA